MSRHTKFDYPSKRSLAGVKDWRLALEISIENVLQGQLGLSERTCRERFLMEAQRTNAKTALQHLEGLGWQFAKKKVLDVGTGQGSLLLELLDRGADAYGIEPGSEYREVARLRLCEAGYRSNRLIAAYAEELPFKSASMDLVFTSQVLEHVREPEVVLKEIYRILKPGGQCYLSCDNYLSFKEPHYYVPWFPLLPKLLGILYLKILGRDPHFLQRYVFYTTYPQIWAICRRVGFINTTYEDLWRKLMGSDRPIGFSHRLARFLLRPLPARLSKNVFTLLLVAIELWRPALIFRLKKECHSKRAG